MNIDLSSFNYLLICLAVLAIINIINGHKRGMVKAIVSLVSLVLLCVVITLLAYGISSYNGGNIFHVVLTVILLTILGVVHHLLKVVFFSAKMISKLPVIHSVDKLLGIVFGLVETVLILWTFYTFVMMMDMGKIENMIAVWTEESRLLTWFYQHNYLAYGIERLLEEFSFIPLAELFSQF